MTFRTERPEDRRVIAEVVEAAFGSSAEAELVDDIRESEYFIPELSVVAQTGPRIVGHVMVSYATLHTPVGKRRVAIQLVDLVVIKYEQREDGAVLLGDPDLLVGKDDGLEPRVNLIRRVDRRRNRRDCRRPRTQPRTSDLLGVTAARPANLHEPILLPLSTRRLHPRHRRYGPSTRPFS
jgi:hypothetical protein